MHDADRLVVVSVRDPSAGRPQYSMSYPAYAYLRDHSTSLHAVLAFRATPVNIDVGGTTERASAMLVSGNYFDGLGIAMALGSAITPDDDPVAGGGGARGVVAVLSHQFWATRLNSDPAVVGRNVRVDGRTLTVVGVAPAAFRGTHVGTLPDLFLPMTFAGELFNMPNQFTGAANHWLRVIGRVRDGVDIAAAQAESTARFQQFTQDLLLPEIGNEPSRGRALRRTIQLRPGQAGLLEVEATVVPPLLALMALMGLVLLLACANVAGLLVARAERYQRDTAICVAIGASAGRLWSQHLVECALLGALGAGAGLLVAYGAQGMLAPLLPAGQVFHVAIDSRIVGVAVLLGLITTGVIGAVTGWQGTRLSVTTTLKTDHAPGRLWLRRSLIVGQLASSLVILVAAILFVQTLRNIRTVETGFARQQLLLASVSPGGESAERRRAFQSQLLEHVRAMPGVSAAALANDEPLRVSTSWSIRRPEDATGAAATVSVPVLFVSPDYFRTMGIAILRGRDIAEGDMGGGFGVIGRTLYPAASTILPLVVNDAFVRQFFLTDEPLGHRVVGNGTMTFKIVGVAANSASNGLREAPTPVMYVPGGGDILHLRSALPLDVVAADLRAVVRRLDPDVPVHALSTIDEHLARWLGRERTFARLSLIFGLLALGLSALGIYGVIAYAVGRRTKEFGIRAALGAERWNLIGLGLREAVASVALGVALGVPAAAFVGGRIAGQLYGVEARDLTSLSLAVFVLSTVAFAAACIPAYRAAAVDPLVALRRD